ncbi:MAG: hypothetical protein K8F59_01705 [Rhodobacteraceae bacterium]|nr:hypothetical protein [Paracoccaceae bacterium]
MSFETTLVIGMVLSVFSLVAILNAWIENSPPRTAAIMVMISGGILVIALLKAEDGLQWHDIPDSFIAVAARILG